MVREFVVDPEYSESVNIAITANDQVFFMIADISHSLTVPLVHPPTHCKSHSSHTLEIGFWYSPLLGVCVRVFLCVGEKWIIDELNSIVGFKMSCK